MSLSRPLSAVLLIATVVSPELIRAQLPPAPGGPCELLVEARNAASPPRFQSSEQPSGERNTFVGGGARWTCPAQGIVVLADSVEYYGDPRIIYLIGHVEYTEPRLRLTSERLTYWLNEERLRSEGNVDATLPSGTNLKGPSVDYYRPAPRIRLQSRMVAPGRPTIRIVERDSTGGLSDPVVVIANTIVMEADSLVFASGRVELTRIDAVARADSMALDNGRQFGRLMRKPVVEGKGQRPFTLYGSVIDIFGRDRLLERAVSSGEARAVSEDVTLTADTLDFRMGESKLQRAYAWGKSRARAVSPSYDIVADSLDVEMPGQRVQRVVGVRNAHAESAPDSLKIRSTERDWMDGDTIVARFDTLRASDSTARAEIRELKALGHARSYYQLGAQDSTALKPAINYVKGKTITVAFEARLVKTVTIAGQESGLYLEPVVAADAGTQRATSSPAMSPAAAPPPAPAKTRSVPPRPPGRVP
ncbi:MAG: hypothetical protein WKG32_00755 [Gemmatimonadaceae bacterium]